MRRGRLTLAASTLKRHSSAFSLPHYALRASDVSKFILFVKKKTGQSSSTGLCASESSCLTSVKSRTTETKAAKKARREETVRRKAVQEEMGLIAMQVFEKLLACESSGEGTTDGSSHAVRAGQPQWTWAQVSIDPHCLPVGLA